MPATTFETYPDSVSRPGLSIVTLNLAKESSATRILGEFRAIPELHEADVYLLQEVSDKATGPCLTSIGSALGLHVAFSPAVPGATDLGLAILSRYPLRDIHVQNLKPYNLRFRSRARFALTATADTPWGPLRLSNAHLDTRLNIADRLAQLEPVVRNSTAFEGRTIVGGDFNSNPFYWIQNVLPLPGIRSQTRGVEEFMTRHGFQTAIPTGSRTFDHLGMHLDWIWVDGLKPTASRVFPLEFSDHRAVWTRAEF
jgi:endonuclease/exonuclease/phosphatase family metal-dependent hydrolase